MKTYEITEEEARADDAWAENARTWLAALTGAVGVFAGLLPTALEDRQNNFVTVGIVVAAILAVIAGWLYRHANKGRSGLWDRIKQASDPVNTPRAGRSLLP